MGWMVRELGGKKVGVCRRCLVYNASNYHAKASGHGRRTICLVPLLHHVYHPATLSCEAGDTFIEFIIKY